MPSRTDRSRRRRHPGPRHAAATAAACETLEHRFLLSLSPAGGEFRVNATTGLVRDNAALAADGDGDFVAVWEAFGQDGSFDGIFARRFNAAGVAQGNEFQVNTYTTGVQSAPVVAMDADGDFVVAWSSNLQDGSMDGVYAQRYNALGVRQGHEFRANSFTTNTQGGPSVAMDVAGNFVIAWYSVNQESSNNVGIYAQRYDFNGVPQGGEFLANSSTPSPQFAPSVALDWQGNFVIAWESGGQDGSNYGIYARRFNRAGAAQAGEFRVNTFTTGLQSGAAVAMSSDGDFFIAWHSQQQDGSGLGAYAQRYDAAGIPQGAEFRVNTHTSSAQLLPKVAMDADGDFLITWNSQDQDGDAYGVYAQHYTKTGAPIGDEFRANSTTSGQQLAPRAAADHKGDFIIAWHGNGVDDFESVYAQRYVESIDSAPPVVAGVFLDGARVLPYSSHKLALQQIAVSFSENLSTAGGAGGANSVTNPANWLVTRDGADITSEISSISYGFNPAANRFEAKVNLSTSHASGNFLLKLRDNVRDIAGNRLDGNLDGAAGGNWLMPFSVGDVIAAGNEFRVNTYTTGFQEAPAVASDAEGNSVVAWGDGSAFAAGDGQDGSLSGVYAQRLDAAGMPRGQEFRVNTFTTGHQHSPAVAMDADGDFVIVWASEQDGSLGVYAQRYNAGGEPQGAEFRVNTFTTDNQQLPAVSMDGAGNFVVAFTSRRPGTDVYAQRFNALGMPQGGEFRVHVDANRTQNNAAVAMRPGGGFVVAWEDGDEFSDGLDGSRRGVYAQRFDALGAPLGPMFRANTFTTGNQSTPQVAIDADGDFTIVWAGVGQGNIAGIHGQRYAASGAALGDEFRVSAFTETNQFRPSLAMEPSGGFAVAWITSNDGSSLGILARRFTADGAPRGDEFTVNSERANSQSNPAVASDAVGELIFAWESDQQDGDRAGVFAQRYGVNQTPTVTLLSGTPDPVIGGNSLTLSASGIIDERPVTSVAFYRESNGEPGLQVGAFGDALVGTTTDSTAGFWTFTIETVSLPPGTYTYWAQATDAGGLTGAPASTTNQVVPGAPAVTASAFHFATLPHKLTFTFDQDVSASLGLEDLVVAMLPAGPTVTPSGLTYDAATNTATVSFAGILADGNYRATLLAAGVSGPGGPMPADYVLDFFFLQGDANHDGRVNLSDFNLLAANFGRSGRDFTQGDFDYNGNVNLADFNILAIRFGQAVAPASRPGGALPPGEGRSGTPDRGKDDDDELAGLLA